MQKDANAVLRSHPLLQMLTRSQSQIPEPNTKARIPTHGRGGGEIAPDFTQEILGISGRPHGIHTSPSTSWKPRSGPTS